MTYAEVKAKASKFVLLADTVDDVVLRLDNVSNPKRPFLISISFSATDHVKQVKVQETDGTEINQLLTEAGKKWGQSHRPVVNARPGAETVASIWGAESGIHVAYQDQLYNQYRGSKSALCRTAGLQPPQLVTGLSTSIMREADPNCSRGARAEVWPDLVNSELARTVVLDVYNYSPLNALAGERVKQRREKEKQKTDLAKKRKIPLE